MRVLRERVAALSDQTRRLTRNMSWLMLQEMAVRALGIATAIYLARVLTPTQYGQLGLALALVAILSKLVEAGTGSRATRLTAIDAGSVRETYAQITGMRLTVAGLLMALLVGAAPLLGSTFYFPPLLIMLCAFLLVRPALAVFWAFRGLEKMHVNAAAVIGERLVAFVGLILLVDSGEQALLWIPVVEAAAALLMVIWLRRQLSQLYPRLRVGMRLSEWPAIARESLPLSLAAVLGAVYLHGAVLLLGWAANPEGAADFLIAQKLMLTLAVLWQVMSRSVFPSASRLLVTDTPAALALVADLLRYYLAAIIGLALLLGLFAEQVLALLFGANYAGAAPVLQLLLAALPCLAISHSLLTLLRARPLPRAVLAGRICSAAVLLSVAAFTVSEHGAIGAAWAVLCGEVSAMLLLGYLAARAFGALPWNSRCNAVVIAGAAAALTFLLASGIAQIAAILFALFTYGGLLLLLGGISRQELRQLPVLAAFLLHQRHTAGRWRR
tara:strand:- start:171 stop:1667 length:1497 start_codon:yes stop_codon:yes gene_type:complete